MPDGGTASQLSPAATSATATSSGIELDACCESVCSLIDTSLTPQLPSACPGLWHRLQGVRSRGPALLFAAWAAHDVEEALAFPDTCDGLADRTGVEALRITAAQSWAAVGMMGIVVAAACWRGTRTHGRSRVYRATVAGLEAHVYTHLAASVAQRRYTAGVATALPIMLPGAVAARHELRRSGSPLRPRDYALGVGLLLPLAFLSQAAARLLPKRNRGSSPRQPAPRPSSRRHSPDAT